MNGEFRVRDPQLQHWHALALKLRAKVACTITHVRREHNTKADALANQALDEKRAPDQSFEKIWRAAIPRTYWPNDRQQTVLKQTSLLP